MKQNPYESELRLIFDELARRLNKALELSKELHINGFNLISVAIAQEDADDDTELTIFRLNITTKKLEALKALRGEQNEVVKAIIDSCIIKNHTYTSGE